MNEFNHNPNLHPEEQATAYTPDAERSAGAVLKLLAIIGLVAVLACAAWLSVQVIRFTPNALSTVSGVSFSSIMNRASDFISSDEDPAVAFTIENTFFPANQPFTLSWQTDEVEGPLTYSLSYSCANDFSLRIMEGTAFVAVYCDEAHTFTTTKTELLIVPVTPQAGETTITLSLETINEESGEPQNNQVQTQLTFSNPNGLVKDDEETEESATSTPETTDETTSDDPAPVVTPTPRPATLTPAPQPQTVFVPNPAVRENPNGTPDLAVTITATGIMTNASDPATFFAIPTIPSNQHAAIKFRVTNEGNKTAASGWQFIATLPVHGDDRYTFRSNEQPSLAPADSIEFTIGFDDITDDTGTAEIEIELVNNSGDQQVGNDMTGVEVSVRS